METMYYTRHGVLLGYFITFHVTKELAIRMNPPPILKEANKYKLWDYPHQPLTPKGCRPWRVFTIYLGE